MYYFVISCRFVLSLFSFVLFNVFPGLVAVRVYTTLNVDWRPRHSDSSSDLAFCCAFSLFEEKDVLCGHRRYAINKMRKLCTMCFAGLQVPLMNGVRADCFEENDHTRRGSRLP